MSVRLRLNLLSSATAIAGAAIMALPAPAAAACGADQYIGSICAMTTDYCPEGFLKADGTLLKPGENQALFSLIGYRFGGDGRTTFALPDLRGRTPVGAGTGNGLTRVNIAQMRGAESVVMSVEQLAQHAHSASFIPTTGSVTLDIPKTPGTPGTPPSLTTVELKANPTTTGNANVPGTGSYLAGSPNGANGAQMWNGAAGSPVALGGLTVTLDPGKAGIPEIPAYQTKASGVLTGGSVEVGAVGASQPIVTLPPQLGLTYCIVNTGLYPVRPN